MVLYRRKWIQTERSEGSSKQVDLYDGGDYIGWLLPSGAWKCWRILERRKGAQGEVEEILEQMPEDWCPFFVASVESYPLLSESKGVLEIPGWRIETISSGVV